jgi:hypothetical protein
METLEKYGGQHYVGKVKIIKGKKFYYLGRWRESWGLSGLKKIKDYILSKGQSVAVTIEKYEYKGYKSTFYHVWSSEMIDFDEKKMSKTIKSRIVLGQEIPWGRSDMTGIIVGKVKQGTEKWKKLDKNHHKFYGESAESWAKAEGLPWKPPFWEVKLYEAGRKPIALIVTDAEVRDAMK